MHPNGKDDPRTSAAKIKESLYAQAEEMRAGCYGSSAAKQQQVVDFYARTPLVDRVNAQRAKAEVEAWRASKLAELAHLLEKNPDVARILDLVELVKG